MCHYATEEEQLAGLFNITCKMGQNSVPSLFEQSTEKKQEQLRVHQGERALDLEHLSTTESFKDGDD